MKYLSYLGATVFTVGLLGNPAMAGTVDFGNGPGPTEPNSQTMVFNGGDVTATAWFEDGGNLAPSVIRRFTPNWGLGVCTSPSDDDANGNCSTSAPHAIDSEGPVDFILIDFKEKVNVTGISITGLDTTNTSRWADYQIWGFANDPTLSNLDRTGLGLPDLSEMDLVVDWQVEYIIPNVGSTFTSPLDAVLIGAHNAYSDNFFKLRSVTYSAVPIPDSALLFGTGLLGYIVFAQRKSFLKT